MENPIVDSRFPVRFTELKSEGVEGSLGVLNAEMLGRDTWLSGILPELLSRYFRKRHREMATLHAVPSALARKKELAAIYAWRWNRHVSPGQPLYAHHGEGEQLLKQAR